MWVAFAVASGCGLGISGLDKTVVAGVGYAADGTPFDAYIPILRTQDGKVVGRATLLDGYPHMGRLRYVHGTVKGEDERMVRAWQGYIAQVRTFDLGMVVIHGRMSSSDEFDLHEFDPAP